MRQTLPLLAAALLCLATVIPPASAHPGSGIVVDDRGRACFTDTGRGVWRIEADGKLTLVTESAMHWLTIDRAGGFARAPESFGEWFGRVTPQGETPALLTCSDFPCVVGADGNLYFAKMHGLTIVRRTPAGEESVLATPDKFDIRADSHSGVNGIASGPNGTIYVVALDSLNRTVGTGEHAIYAIARDGAVRTVAKNFIREKLPAAEQYHEVRPEYTRGLAVDREGNVFVAATGNRCVMKVTPAGETSVVLKSQKPWTPTGVEVADGEVYVLEYDDETPTEGRNWPPRVRKVGRDGKVTVLATVDRK